MRTCVRVADHLLFGVFSLRPIVTRALVRTSCTVQGKARLGGKESWKSSPVTHFQAWSRLALEERERARALVSCWFPWRGNMIRLQRASQQL